MRSGILGVLLVACTNGADAVVADAVVVDAGRLCTASLAGEGSFGAVLGGTVELTNDAGFSGSREVSVEVYFPQGRVAGAPVVFSNEEPYYYPGAASWTETLADGRSALVRWGGSLRGEDAWVEGSLRGPDDGIDADVGFNVARYTDDVVDIARGHTTLCPTGPAPGPALDLGDAYGPRSTLLLAPNVPLDPATVTLSVRSRGAPVDVVADVRSRNIIIRPVAAFPPGWPLDIDLGEPRDILGRPFAVSRMPRPLETTAVVEDLDFVVAPPPGAVAATDYLGVEDGLLIITTYGGDPRALLIALPDPGAATQARIRLEKRDGLCSVDLALVAASGESSAFPHPDLYAPEELTASLPAGRPLWLVVTGSFDGSLGCLPQNLCSPCSLGIDQILFT